MQAVKILSAGCLSLILGICGLSRADTVLYSNGFENANDQKAFINNANSVAGDHITRTSGGGSGAFGYTPSSGSSYAVIQNTPNAYSAGLGDSTYTYYGSAPTYAPTSYGGSGPFTETIDYYVDTATWLPVNGQTAGFLIDSSPAGPTGHSDYADEVNFHISVSQPGQIKISALNSGTLATITQSGWYTFSMSFNPGADGFIHNTLEVLNHSGGVVGSTFAYTSTMPNADLTGTRYGDWTTEWTNGFAGDQLAIDNADVTAAPLPATAWMGMALLGGVGAFAIIRRRIAAAA